jgi:phage shock protein A
VDQKFKEVAESLAAIKEQIANLEKTIEAMRQQVEQQKAGSDGPDQAKKPRSR